MNKKVWVGTIVVFLLYFVLAFVVHGVLLKDEYATMSNLFRPESEVNSLMWIFVVTDAFFAFFFTLIFSKGYENKGIAEGVRYGLYVGLMMKLPAIYGVYAVMPMSYRLTMQSFLYEVVMVILCGVALALVFKPKAPAAA
ncbi:MAG TPA: hypothetical protein VII11_06555 [Bacteroidota bacterium]